MKTNWHALTAWLLALGLCVSAVALAPAAEDKKEPEKSDPADAPNPVLEISTTAYKTAQFGRDRRVPDALVTAGVMLLSLRSCKLEPIDEQPTDEDGKPISEKGPAPRKFEDQAKDLFDEARLMAAEQKIEKFEDYIKSAKDRAPRDVVGGARLIRRKLDPGRTECFKVKFKNQTLCAMAIRATHPVLFYAEEAKDHRILANALTMLAASQGLTGGKPEHDTTVIIKVTNPNLKRVVEFELLVE